MMRDALRTEAEGPGDRAAVATAIFLWVLVTAGLAYGVVSTIQKVVDLFAG